MPDPSAQTAQSDRIPLQKVVTILLVSLSLGILFDYLFYKEATGLNFPLYIVLIVCVLIALSIRFGRRINVGDLWLLVPVAFFSAMVYLRANELLSVINILASALLLMLVTETIFTGSLRKLTINEIIPVVALPARFAKPSINTVSRMQTLAGNDKNKLLISRVTKGIIFAGPVVMMFLLMLISADMIFRKYTSNFVDQVFNAEMIGRTLLVAFWALFFVGGFSYLLMRESGAGSNEPIVAKTRDYKVEIGIVLGAVNVLFALFMIVQFVYFFGGAQNVAASGITYSDYARSGFFELIAVAVLAFSLILVTDRFSGADKLRHSLLFKVLAGGVIIQTFLIMVSAFMRLSLYEEAYGFTTLRLHSHLFIVFLGAIFLLLLYKIVIDNNERAFVFRSLIVMILAVSTLNILNPDAFIARQNISRFQDTGKLDVSYLSELSSDATPEVVRLLEISEGEMRRDVLDSLYWRYRSEANALSKNGWQSRNHSCEQSISTIKSAVIDPGL